MIDARNQVVSKEKSLELELGEVWQETQADRTLIYTSKWAEILVKEGGNAIEIQQLILKKWIMTKDTISLIVSLIIAHVKENENVNYLISISSYNIYIITCIFKEYIKLPSKIIHKDNIVDSIVFY